MDSRRAARTEVPAAGRAAAPGAAVEGAAAAWTAPAGRPGDGLLQLQRARGNRHVRALLQPATPAAAAASEGASRTGEAPRIGDAGDRWERAADRSASRVAGRVAGSVSGPADGPAGGAGTPAGALPQQVRESLEGALGGDFGDVRVHTDGSAHRISAALRAEAFTSGQDIWFGRGAYDPWHGPGIRLLAHELTHVMQQQRGAGGAAAPAGPDGAAVRLKPLANPKAEADRQYLKQRFGGGSAKEIKKRLAKRLPDGPPLTGMELLAIDDLSAAGPGAVQWLDDTGLGTTASAMIYLRGNDFTRWLRLSPATRLHYASRAFAYNLGRDDLNPPPSYTLGRHMAIESGHLTGKTQAKFEQERDQDIENAFILAMQPADPALVRDRDPAERFSVERASRILRRVFLLMHTGVAVYDERAADHLDFEGSVARVLAHGGRVNVRIPSLSQGGGGYDLTDWLGITQGGKKVKGTVRKRDFGTHHMSIESNKDLLGRERDAPAMKETGGKLAAVSNTFDSKVKLWGVNLTAGGYGRTDFNGDVILPNGAHGHMFIGFTKPDFYHDGALQIGIESTEPDAKSPVGYKHNWNSTEATANPESSFYGHKAAKVGGGKLSKNQRLIDLNEVSTIHNQHWLRVLEKMEAAWDTALSLDPDVWEQLVGPAMGKG